MNQAQYKPENPGRVLVFLSFTVFFFLPSCRKDPVPVTPVSERHGRTITKVYHTDPNQPQPRSEERLHERRRMVEIIRDYYGLVDEKVLDAMLNVPRHWFVTDAMQELAYADRPLPIGYDQTISQPFIVAYMTSLLELDENKKVLEIGTGSGYQAAVLSELTPHVFSIEIVEPLGQAAIQRLKKLGYKTIKVKIGDGYKGFPEYQPFDAVIVTCAPDKIPPALIEQLKPGGKMIIPVGPTFAVQQLLLITKSLHGDVLTRSLMPVRFVPMLHDNKQNHN